MNSPEVNQRAAARDIFEAALASAGPRDAVARHLRGLSEAYRRIWLVGAGKAAAAMASAAEEVLGERIHGGAINTKYGHGLALQRVQTTECGHPVPDEAGVAGARRIEALCRNATAEDLVLCLISGGASALLPLPAPPVTLADKQATTQLLLACGAPIQEINAVRKHLSAIKGGQLARTAAPATVLSLILSDVIGDDLAVIGSGPTAPDPSTFAGARQVLRQYGLEDRVPPAVIERLNARAPETPKPGDALFDNVRNIIVGSNRQALDAAARRAEQLGYRAVIVSGAVEGEARDVAAAFVARARQTPGRVCLISGGEPTVTLRGTGKGGRNQEFALAAAIALAGVPHIVALSAGTDGTDGPTDAAGAIVDGETVARAAALGLSSAGHLEANDAYPLFKAVGDLIRTGPTGTNVMDIQLMLVHAE